MANLRPSSARVLAAARVPGCFFRSLVIEATAFPEVAAVDIEERALLVPGQMFLAGHIGHHG
jgi:hypothetical protein